MSTYIVVDLAHLFARCKHVTSGDAFSRSGMALHIVFNALRKCWRDFGGQHVVFCLEGRSWRHDVFPKYKAHRRLQLLERTIREQEEDEVFKLTFDDFVSYVTEHTRCTVLHHPDVEGDDWVARWVQLHPADRHILLGGDSDFLQLLAPNVTIYDGVNERTITAEGVRSNKGETLSFRVNGTTAKLKVGETMSDFCPEDRWWEWALFMKCIRGDAGDNIYAAYPKVREPKIRAAFDDRETRGYDWNNFMLQTWVDKDGNEVRVLDAYRRNRMLIDLTCQPDYIKESMDDTIVTAVQKGWNGQAGLAFLRFCDKHSLVNVSRDASEHALWLNAAYAR